MIKNTFKVARRGNGDAWQKQTVTKATVSISAKDSKNKNGAKKEAV